MEGLKEMTMVGYFEQIKNIPLINVEEEKILAEIIQQRFKEIIRGVTETLSKNDEILELIEEWRRKDGLNPCKKRLETLKSKLEIIATKKDNDKAFEKFFMDFLDKKKSIENAAEKLVLANVRLVVSIAREYSSNGNLPDIIQEGNLGLLRAAYLFSPDFSNKFSTYAEYWIRQKIFKFRQETEMIRIPKKILSNKKNVGKFLEKVSGENLPTLEEIMEANGLSRDEVIRLIDLPQAISLEHPIGEDMTILDIVKNKSGGSTIDKVAIKSDIGKIKKELINFSPMTQKIIRLRYGIGEVCEHTLRETGEILGISHERVRQLEEIFLRKIKKILR